MRKYCIGAFPLELFEPTKAIGRLREPLPKAKKSDREGYVPNGVAPCGSPPRDRQVIVPFARFYYDTIFAAVSLDEVSNGMECAAWRRRLQFNSRTWEQNYPLATFSVASSSLNRSEICYISTLSQSSGLFAFASALRPPDHQHKSGNGVFPFLRNSGAALGVLRLTILLNYGGT